MTHEATLDPLILDLLEWIAREPRSHADVIEAWRTSCPRLTVWEDAVDRGFVVREHGEGRDVLIRLTAEGRDFLRTRGRIVHEAPAGALDDRHFTVQPSHLVLASLINR